MNINQLALRFNDHPNPTPGSTPIEHPYRQRWWLPIIGPTSTCLLNHLAPQAANDDWHLTQVTTLAATIGLGKGTGRHSPLLKSIDRLIRFGFGHYDLEPSDHTDPCITLYRTTSLPPAHITQNWPTEMQQAHALDLDLATKPTNQPRGGTRKGVAPSSLHQTHSHRAAPRSGCLPRGAK